MPYRLADDVVLASWHREDTLSPDSAPFRRSAVPPSAVRRPSSAVPFRMFTTASRAADRLVGDLAER